MNMISPKLKFKLLSTDELIKQNRGRLKNQNAFRETASIKKELVKALLPDFQSLSKPLSYLGKKSLYSTIGVQSGVGSWKLLD